MRSWNWSWYSVNLTLHREINLRLRIQCARGWEATLARLLRASAEAEGLRFRCVPTRGGRIDVRAAASVVQAVRRMGPSPALAAALDEYEAATALCRRGLARDPALTERLQQACRRVLALFPQPPGPRSGRK